MIEHLKNIGVGLWVIGVFLSVVVIGMLFCYLQLEYTVIVTPVLVVIIAWSIGKFLRTK